MTEQPILKPCPFCGSGGAKLCVAYDPTMEEVMKPSYMVSCRECGTRGPMRNTQEGAIEAWNARKGGGVE